MIKEPRKFQNITFHCPVEIAARLDRMASKGQVTRSRLVLKMVSMFVSYLEATQKVGIIHLPLLFRDAVVNLKDVGQELKEKVLL